MPTSEQQTEEAFLKRDSSMFLAVARAIALQDGLGEIDSYACPDDNSNTAGAPQGNKFIDLVATTVDQHSLALEHTVIESYEGQLNEARQIKRLLLPLEQSLFGQLANDRAYVLSVPRAPSATVT